MGDHDSRLALELHSELTVTTAACDYVAVGQTMIKPWLRSDVASRQ
jgi:hypothetical protein